MMGGTAKRVFELGGGFVTMNKNFTISSSARRGIQFNLTPMIDVVFILITFFMLICRTIGQENYKMTIPDQCAQAELPEQIEEHVFTVSVFFPSAASQTTGAEAPWEQAPLYAVRAEVFDPQSAAYQENPDLLIAEMAKQISRVAKKKKAEMVHLRADKNLTYAQVQPVLQAMAQAQIRTVRLAAFRVGQSPAVSENSGRETK
jgi:biopolymer transport protein ExbD